MNKDNIGEVYDMERIEEYPYLVIALIVKIVFGIFRPFFRRMKD